LTFYIDIKVFLNVVNEEQEEPGDIHRSWLNVGATRILKSISSLIEWCPSGICWIMIL